MPKIRRRRPVQSTSLARPLDELNIVLGRGNYSIRTYRQLLRDRMRDLTAGLHAPTYPLSSKLLRRIQSALSCGRLLKFQPEPTSRSMAPARYCRDTRMCQGCACMNAHRWAEAREGVITEKGPQRAFQGVVHWQTPADSTANILVATVARLLADRLPQLRSRYQSATGHSIFDLVASPHIRRPPSTAGQQLHLHVFFQVTAEATVTDFITNWENLIDHEAYRLSDQYNAPQVSKIAVEHVGRICASKKAAERAQGKAISRYEVSIMKAYVVTSYETDDAPGDSTERHAILDAAGWKRQKRGSVVGAKPKTVASEFPSDYPLLLLPFSGDPCWIQPDHRRDSWKWLMNAAAEIVNVARDIDGPVVGHCPVAPIPPSICCAAKSITRLLHPRPSDPTSGDGHAS